MSLAGSSRLGSRLGAQPRFSNLVDETTGCFKGWSAGPAAPVRCHIDLQQAWRPPWLLSQAVPLGKRHAHQSVECDVSVRDASMFVKRPAGVSFRGCGAGCG